MKPPSLDYSLEEDSTGFNFFGAQKAIQRIFRRQNNNIAGLRDSTVKPTSVETQILRFRKNTPAGSEHSRTVSGNSGFERHSHGGFLDTGYGFVRFLA
jgi:hypothetical protein